VRLLLAHGADANVGYHDLRIPTRGFNIHGWDEPLLGVPEPAREDACRYGCGRVVELAMALRLGEIVRLLLEAGADVGVAHPVWNVLGHECGFVPRDVYQRVTAGLRAVAKEGVAEAVEGRVDGEAVAPGEVQDLTGVP
jgi:serum/glucocorticoid-regulated kinase 2